MLPSIKKEKYLFRMLSESASALYSQVRLYWASLRSRKQAAIWRLRDNNRKLQDSNGSVGTLFMKPGSSMPHSQAFSNNRYHELNQSNFLHYLFNIHSDIVLSASPRPSYGYLFPLVPHFIVCTVHLI